jgi:hypothetical protein
MSRQSVAILLTSEPNYDEFALKYFILNLNKIQNYWLCRNGHEPITFTPEP